MLVAIVVFVGAFAVIALLLFAGGAGKARTEQTLAHLETALASNRPSSRILKDIDVRKEEVFSKIPWLDRWLLNLEIAPRLSVLLHQADLGWTTGGLILAVAACLVIPS